MKVMNPDWERIEEKPMNIVCREEVGRVLKLGELDRTAETVEALLNVREEYRAAITACLERSVYHLGESAEVEAKYIIAAIRRKIQERKETN